ncbi:MAG: hypothetical protein V1862_04580 [Methanobacteriota archaeon]
MRCTSYEPAGATLPGVSKSSESYTGRVAYENAEAKTVGTISIKAPTPSAFSTDVSTIIATTDLNTVMGGTPSHDNSEDRFSCTLKCQHGSGELYSVRFARDSTTLSSYEADSIRKAFETWVDTMCIRMGLDKVRIFLMYLTNNYPYAVSSPQVVERGKHPSLNSFREHIGK